MHVRGTAPRTHAHAHRAQRRPLARVGTPPRTVRDANTPATAASRQAMRDAVVCLINQQRASHHLPALHVSTDLNRSAQGWTERDGHHRRSSPTAPTSPAGSARPAITWSSAGENIATGFLTPRQVVKAGWRAPTTARTSSIRRTADVGTGLSNHRARAATAPSTWTQDFGLWMGHRAPSGNCGPQHGCPYHI